MELPTQPCDAASLLPTTALAAGNPETTDITEIKLTGNYQYGNVPQEYYLHLILELLLIVLLLIEQIVTG